MQNARRPLHVEEGSASAWSEWFAWRPVRDKDTHRRLWLFTIECRVFYAAPWFLTGNIHWNEYRRPKVDAR